MDEKTIKEKELSARLLEEIKSLTAGREHPMRLMEVCGTHTPIPFRFFARGFVSSCRSGWSWFPAPDVPSA